jgi:hypothetical protein
MTPKSGKLVPLVLDELDLGQAMDGIEIRAEAYERTAAYLDGDEEDDADDPFIIEEVNDADEARAIAEHYRHIHDELERQWDEWRKSQGKETP